MSLFDGNNPDADAAMIGGIIGFAEESLEVEDEIFKEDKEELEIDDSALPFDIRVFKAQHSLMFKEVVKSVLEYHREAAKRKQLRDEILNNEFYYELEEMEKSKGEG